VGESERVLGVIEYKSRYNHFPLTPQNSTAQPPYHSDQYTIVIVLLFQTLHSSCFSIQYYKCSFKVLYDWLL